MFTELLEKRKKNNLEVEDLLPLANGGVKKDLIKDLKNLRGVKVENNGLYQSETIDTWIETLIVFFENGYPSLIQIAKEGNEKSIYAIGILGATKTEDGFRSLVAILENSSYTITSQYEIAGNVISAINEMVSFDNTIKIDEVDAALARKFLHQYLIYANKFSSNEADLVIVCCALRRIGNSETIKLIKEMRPLIRPENSGIDKIAISAIKKRLD